MLICNKCGKQFKYKSVYDKHLKNKNDCSLRMSKEEKECEYCFKTYSRSDNLRRHLKTCKKKKKEEEMENEAKNVDINIFNDFPVQLSELNAKLMLEDAICLAFKYLLYKGIDKKTVQKLKKDHHKGKFTNDL